jgi:hypothetical protein
MDASTPLRPDRPAIGIGAEERKQRRAAIDYARTSMRLEGFELDAATEALNERYIDGEITNAEHSALIRASAGL